MIEVETGQQALPPASGMARLAGLLELSAMRINVTRRTGVELHPRVASRPSLSIGFVTFFAGHLGVQTG